MKKIFKYLLLSLVMVAFSASKTFAFNERDIPELGAAASFDYNSCSNKLKRNTARICIYLTKSISKVKAMKGNTCFGKKLRVPEQTI